MHDSPQRKRHAKTPRQSAAHERVDLKILLTHPSADLYGSDRMALLAMRALVKRGHAVTAVVPDDGPLISKIRESRGHVIIADTPVLRKSDLSVLGFPRLLWSAAASQSRIARIVRSVDPDVVYVNTIVQPWWIAWGKFQRRRVVVHVREAEGQLHHLLKTMINAPLMLADVILCNSKSTQREIASVLPMSRKQILVVYNGKDWSAYQSQQSVRSSCDAAAPLRLTVVGRLSPRKGQDIAIRALAEIISTRTDATLTFVGGVFPGYEWYEHELKQTAAKLDLADRVKFIGFQEDIRPVLAQTDIAIVPSRIEPFGTVAAECMAAGVLTIVADVQGLAEIVENGTNGLTFSADDHRALARCCIWALGHPEESKKLALTGQRDVHERFSLDRYEREVVEALESVERINV
jgi:glycosyltransferase involved in cell wall biosynthesis